MRGGRGGAAGGSEGKVHYRVNYCTVLFHVRTRSCFNGTVVVEEGLLEQYNNNNNNNNLLFIVHFT